MLTKCYKSANMQTEINLFLLSFTSTLIGQLISCTIKPINRPTKQLANIYFAKIISINLVSIEMVFVIVVRWSAKLVFDIKK